jgi:lipoic acid synthetase
MLYIDTSRNTDDTCSFYFGLEEYLIKDYGYSEDIFLLWNVVPTVMIGRHQVTSLEIDMDYLNDNNIQVVRRNSGGGAVYTDKGCLQFSFITSKSSHKDIFTSHISKIIDAVNSLGLKAEFTGRNDILHDGRKFSGNAEYIYKDRMVIHGTILFDSNLGHLVNSLTPDKSKLSKHAISSVSSRVVNIGTIIDKSLEDFYNYIVNEIKTRKVDMDELDLDTIHAYSEKFKTDEWNFGKNPAYYIVKKDKFDAGLLQVNITVKHNLITTFKLTGDFFSLNKLEVLENAFIGKEYDLKVIRSLLKEYKVKDYIYKAKNKDILDLMFERQTHKKKPDYLKIDMRDLNKKTKEIRSLLRQHNLHTVCQEASCPNQLECFSNKTATFMILGTKCTRNCRFCDVLHGQGDIVDPYEPKNILHAVQLMKLKHVVITSVTRDDLSDYGSDQFVKVIKILKEQAPDTTVEVLIPDFMGDLESLKKVVDAKPDVINHNLETIESLYEGFRDNASYQRSLQVLKRVKDLDDTILTKSGIMVGIGETQEEVLALMDDLRDIQCDILTIGQYLQPSKDHVDVKEYVSLETFEYYKNKGKDKGFKYVASGPMVRSSYQALKQFEGE